MHTFSSTCIEWWGVDEAVQVLNAAFKEGLPKMQKCSQERFTGTWTLSQDLLGLGASQRIMIPSEVLCSLLHQQCLLIESNTLGFIMMSVWRSIGTAQCIRVSVAHVLFIIHHELITWC